MKKIILFGDNDIDINYLKEQLVKLKYTEETVAHFTSIKAFYRQLSTFNGSSYFFVSFALLHQSGIGVLRQLRETFPDIPIIILAALEEEEEVLKYISEGVQSYLLNGHYDYVLLNKAMHVSQEQLRLKNEIEIKNRIVENILNTVTDSFYSVDKEWIIRYCNQAAGEVIGKKCDELIGQNIWQFFSKSAWTNLDSAFKKAMYEQKSAQIEYLSPVTSKWYEITLYPSINSMSVYFRDITKRKESEYEKEQMIKELVKSNNDLEEFSYITSHNFRGPLSNLQSILNIVKADNLDEENRMMFDLMRTVTGKLAATIDDLTKVLIIKNKINIPLSRFRFKYVFDDACANFLKFHYDIPVKLNTDFKVDEINFNRTYLESIFRNLISNAIKYRSPNRSLTISVCTHINKNGNTELQFKDNGTGMDLTKVGARLFGMYQRFHENSEGEGLGLFNIKSKIMALNGTISAKSLVNKGTTFIITFSKKNTV